MVNRRLRKYVKIMLRNDTPEGIINRLLLYKNKNKRSLMIKYLKSISIDYEVCPYCNNKYGEKNVLTNTGNEFKDDGIYVCCHNCALSAGLDIS